MYDYLGGKSMTDAEQREAARQFVNRWMGKGKEDELILSGGAKPGQDIVVTKYLGMEGTGIIANRTFEL